MTRNPLSDPLIQRTQVFRAGPSQANFVSHLETTLDDGGIFDNFMQVNFGITKAPTGYRLVLNVLITVKNMFDDIKTKVDGNTVVHLSSLKDQKAVVNALNDYMTLFVYDTIAKFPYKTTLLGTVREKNVSKCVPYARRCLNSIPSWFDYCLKEFNREG